MTTHTTIDSPLGELTLVQDDGHLRGVYLPRQAHRPAPAVFGPRDSGGFTEVRAQLAAYFAGERTSFALPLAAAGDAFDQRVWAQVAAIPYGETVAYGQIAARLGDPRLAREVGAAVGRNPLLVVVPCHRVIAANGALGGFAVGVGRKRWLLAHENPARWRAAAPPATQLALAGAAAR